MLDFLINLKAEPFGNLLAYDRHIVPEKPGSYILFANSGVQFIYPSGLSPVFYIGQGINLQNRLNRRRQQISQAMRKQPGRVYPPQFEYGAAFGANFSYVLTAESQYPKALEDSIMAMFAYRYSSLPVANSANSWLRINQIIESAMWH